MPRSPRMPAMRWRLARYCPLASGQLVEPGPVVTRKTSISTRRPVGRFHIRKNANSRRYFSPACGVHTPSWTEYLRITGDLEVVDGLDSQSRPVVACPPIAEDIVI